MKLYEVEGWYVSRQKFSGTVIANSAREAARMARESSGNIEDMNTEMERTGPTHIIYTRRIDDD